MIKQGYRKLILGLVVMSLIGVFAYLVSREKQPEARISQQTQASNTKQMITGDDKLHQLSDYQIQAGFYDVSLVSGELKRFSVQGLKQGKTSQLYLKPSDGVQLTKGGQLRLTSSQLDKKIEPLIFAQPGQYLVGKQIPAGRYKIKRLGEWTGMSDTSYPTTVTVTSLDMKGDMIDDNRKQGQLHNIMVDKRLDLSTVTLYLVEDSQIAINFDRGTADTRLALVAIE